MAKHSQPGVTLNSNGDYWQASWINASGRRVRKSIGAKSKMTRRRAERRCRELEAQHIATPAAREAGQAPSLAAWCARYLEIRTDLAESTVTLHKETIAYLERYFDPNRRLDRFTRTDATNWRAWMGANKARAGEPEPPGLAEATVCRHVRTAKVIVNAAVTEDRLVHNVFDRLKGTAPKPAKDWRQLTADDLAKLVDAANGPDWRRLIALCAYAGLRRGEALALTWGDIDWSGNRITIRARGGQVTTKQKQRHTLLEPVLERILLEQEPGGAGERIVNVSANNLHVRMLATITRAGFTPWDKPFHTLRKNRATTWRAIYPEHVVDTWLGHSLDVARDHYTAVPDSYYGRGPSVSEQLADALAEIERLKNKESADAPK